jgi:hypothetical protein
MDITLTKTPTDIVSLSPIQAAVIKTLLYFDIFRYPLTKEEVYENCQGEGCEDELLYSELRLLLLRGLIFEKEGFYHLSTDNTLIERRKKGNEHALAFIPKAKSFTKLISLFPFVEAVFISGSLAKGFVDEESDIDYFIITRPGRLWVCRTCLILFKKIFLLNSKKYFCVNYFIDSDNLLLPDQNIFTATELVFAKPFYNPEMCFRFIESNDWRHAFYPNKPLPGMQEVQKARRKGMKQVFEWILKGSIGEKLDSWCFRTTLRFWKKKFANFDESEFDLNFRSRKNVSKHHPGGFQFRVLKSHTENINAFSEKHRVKFTS